MVLFRTLLSPHFHTLTKHPNPSNYLKTHLYSPYITTHYIFSTNSHKLSSQTSIFQRPISLSAQFETKNSDNYEDETKKTKKPLHVLFKEAVGLSEKIESSESEDEDEEETDLKKKLRKLEQDVRRLRDNITNSKKREKVKKEPEQIDEPMKNIESNSRSLYALFTNKEAKSEKSVDDESLKKEDPMVFKELSTDMVLFADHLFKEGYFKDANFLPGNKFNATCFENRYGRDFLKYAAEKFGKDHQEIAKWLSGSDLKKVAMFGCPSLAKKNVFSAKRLRTFFRIQEDVVCSKCVLKQSCKFANQSVWKGDTKNLNLAVIMRVITLYALEAVPPQLVVPGEIKVSVSRLLKEILNLSKTVS